MTLLSISLPLVGLCSLLGGLPHTPICAALEATASAVEAVTEMDAKAEAPATEFASATEVPSAAGTPAEPAAIPPERPATVVAQAAAPPAKAPPTRPATPAPEAETPPAAEAAQGAAPGGRVSSDAAPLVAKVQRFYENTDDFKAKFHQTYTYTVGRQVESRGEVAFKKPAMMRWDYQHPRERTFIVDGTDLWVWTPEDLSVVRQRGFTASDLSTSITFLWGEGRLADEFHIELEGDDRLVLTPIRPEGGFRQVVFRVDAETGRVRESTVIDPQGNRNHMVFTDVDLNSGVDSARFQFSPPSGADVQDMPALRQ